MSKCKAEKLTKKQNPAQLKTTAVESKCPQCGSKGIWKSAFHTSTQKKESSVQELLDSIIAIDKQLIDCIERILNRLEAEVAIA